MTKTKVKKRVYIAGPMTGKQDYNRPAFNQAAAAIATLGHIPVNPAVLPLGLEYNHYIGIGLAMLEACDVLVLLPGWKSSKGAGIEIARARETNKPIFELSSFIKGASL